MENKMTNQERLKEYLVGEKGYLKNDISNGKVVMLSGKWGSGKTHFWKNIIEKDLIEFQTKKQKAYIYTSLYGNTSINKIEDNIYAQVYLCSIGGENIVLKGYEKVKDFGKRFGSFCSLLDVSKLIDGVDEIQKNNIKNSALLYLEKGGIVCFDDFERKSKDIDLNDLFGFITQLTQNFNCKVVIILNDDVFEGEEKKIFSNVKEKSVSKFLKYEPSVKELFETIFSDDKYRILDSYKKIILETIERTKELNARIYIQVLDNLVEWVDRTKKDSDNYLKYLIYVNINFILNHLLLYAYFNSNKKGIAVLKETSNFLQENEINLFLNCVIEKIPEQIDNILDSIINIEDLINKINIKKDKESISTSTNQIIDNRQQLNDFISRNENLIRSLLFLKKINLKELIGSNNKAELEVFNKISNFIESGILINE